MTRMSLATAAMIAGLFSTATAQMPPRSDSESSARTLRILPGQSIKQALALGNARLRSLPSVTASLRQTAGDVRFVAPTISDGTVLSKSVVVGKAGSYPRVKFHYTAGNAGLQAVYLFFVSPDQKDQIVVVYSPAVHTVAGTVEVTSPATPPYYAPPGQWTLQYALAEDYIGQYTQYSQAQLAQIFSPAFLTVINNGPVDVTLPVITSGKIDTPTIDYSSPLPVFQASLASTDDVAGVLAAFVAIQPPGSDYSFVTPVNVPVPFTSGIAHAYTVLPSGFPTGNWKITGFALCDAASNCFDDEKIADVKSLFGMTSITVK